MLSRSQSYKTIGIYTFAGFLNKGITFLFLPFLTAYLQPSDYGVLTLFSNAISLLAPFISLSVIASASTDFFKYDEQKFRIYFSSILLLPILISLVSIFFIFVFGKPLADYFHVSIFYLLLIPVMALCGFFTELLLTMMRNRNRYILFIVVSVIRTVFELLVSIGFIVLMSMSWNGRLFGWLITGILSAVFALYYFNRNRYLTNKIDYKYLPHELRYSIPIIINQFAIFSVISSDKFFVAKYLQIEDVGIYSVASQVAFIAFAFGSAVIMYFNPYLYASLSKYSEQKKKEVASKIIRFIIGMFFVCLTIVALTPLVYHYIINVKYQAGARYVKWIVLAYFFWFINWMLLGFLYYFKLKKAILFTSLAAILLSVALNFVFVKWYGITGAIYTLNISCFVAMLGLFLLLRFRYKMI